MKKKFLTFILSICFALPCAIFLAGCNSSGGPTLNGYEVYINGQKTNEYTCYVGEEAITWEDVVIKSNWTDASKNAVVPLTDFDLSVKWIDQNSSEQTTMPNFWTGGDTSTAFATTYNFSLQKDGWGEVATFKVIISKRPIQNAKVCFTKGSEKFYELEMEWNHNARYATNENNQYKLDVENIESGYNKEDLGWCVVKKEDYDAKTTIQEKKAFVKTIGTNQEEDSIWELSPGTYLIFTYIYSDKYVYGEDKDGWIYNYATLTVTEANVEQSPMQHIVNYTDHYSFYSNTNVGIYWPGVNTISEELSLSGIDPDTQFWCRQYCYDGNEWKLQCNPQDQTQDKEEIQVHAIKDSNGKYQRVDLKNFDTSLTEWVYINNDGTKGEDVIDTSKIEVVGYTQLDYYTNVSTITIPVYYKINDMSDTQIYVNTSTLYRTEVTINKHRITGTPPSFSLGDHENVTSLNEFTFTYQEYTDSYEDYFKIPHVVIDHAVNTMSDNYEFINFDFENRVYEYSDSPYQIIIGPENPNFAWSKDGMNYHSTPVAIRFYIKKSRIEIPTYKFEQVSGTNYFKNPIEVLWDGNCDNYQIDDHLTFTGNYVNVYKYKVQSGDNQLLNTELAEKIRQQGTLVTNYSEKIVTGSNNVAGTQIIVMYELKNTTSTVWDKGTNGSTNPIMFKFELCESLEETITFMIGDEVYTTQTVSHGDKITRPEDPEIPGYDFLGWFLQANFMSPYNFDSLVTKAYKDLVLYGKIAENKTEVDNVTPAEAFEVQTAGASTDEVIIKGITTNHKNLTSLIIPRFYNGKTVVGITADVCNLSQLVEVSIPHTIRTIDERAFSQCPKLTEFKLQTSSEYFAVDGGVLYSITDDEKSLLRYPAAKTALEYATLTDTKAILSNAFEGVSILGILTINAQEIKSYAFEGATSIIDITLSNGVTTVADDAFLNYYALQEMTSNSAYIEVADGAIYSAGKTKLIKFFGKGSNINYVTPNTVETICAYAFRECSNIVSIELGPNCVNVGIGAMRNCTGLVTVTIRGNADATNTIDNEFIRNCNAITTIYLNMTSTNKFYTILQAGDYADKLQQLV